MATQAGDIYQEQVKACEARKVSPLATLENPPGSEESGGAWDLPELQKALEETNGVKIPYHSCAFMVKEKQRFLKPGVWAGRLAGIEKLQKVCRCPAWVKHVPLVGKQMTSLAAEYPQGLAEAVAKEVVVSWKKTLNLEWWRYQIETKSQEVGELQKKWLENEDNKGKTADTRPPPQKRAAAMAFKIDNIESDDMASGSKTLPIKELKEHHNFIAVGGMRNPARSVKRLTQLAEVGEKISKLWDEFQESHPKVLEVARRYGKTDNTFDEELVAEWRLALLDNFTKIQDKPMVT